MISRALAEAPAQPGSVFGQPSGRWAEVSKPTERVFSRLGRLAMAARTLRLGGPDSSKSESTASTGPTLCLVLH